MYRQGTEGHTTPNASAKCYCFSQVAEHYRTKYVHTYTAVHIGNNGKGFLVHTMTMYGGVVVNLILMDPCIVDYSVEIPTRCSFVIEFIIPRFFLNAHVSSGTQLIIKSSKLYLQPLVYILQ